MRWPWVSRRAFDLVLDERDHLREQIDLLQGTVVQIKRIRSGLSPKEVHRQVKPPPNTDPMPESMRLLIGGFGSKAVRDAMSERCDVMRKAGTPWPEIESLMRREAGIDEVESETD